MDDSTVAEETRNRKRARLTSSAAGDVDRISSLNDDVLLHVLELVGDVRDVVRTGALSRWWLGLWKRVPALSFASRSVWEASGAEEWAALKRYVSSVNNVLVLRSQSGCAIERLAISYTTYSPDTDPEHKNGLPASVDAFCNNVVSFTLSVSATWNY
ncbi:putative FBD-associated F-box protein At5g56440 [Miscanthus floridulus]|uniref:putative FBD-associated F-box protein At5g56440 n=1 Tax=Miscanthus floridulus TaxID=154761 RepID=UPI00345A81EB